MRLFPLLPYAYSLINTKLVVLHVFFDDPVRAIDFNKSLRDFNIWYRLSHITFSVIDIIISKAICYKLKITKSENLIV